MLTTSLTTLPVTLSLLCAGFQVPDDWGLWGDDRSAIEYSSLLSCVDIDPQNNRLVFDKKKLPLVSVYVPWNFQVKAKLAKVGGNMLYSQDFVNARNDLAYPFQQIAPNQRTEKPFVFTEPGDYLLRFTVNDIPITELNFTVEFIQDPLKPKPLAIAKGPWEKWAYLWFPYRQRENGRPEVRLWRRISTGAKPASDKYTVHVLKDGNVVAEAASQTVTSIQHTRLRFPLSLPASRGGGQLLANEFLARPGTYQVLVRKNGELDAVYPFDVKLKLRFGVAGAVNQPMFDFHRNQLPNHFPHGDYIVPRMPSDTVQRQGGGDTIWMTRLSSLEAAQFGTVKLTKTQSPSSSELDDWQIKPAIDPNRPFQLVVTDVETPAKSRLSAGDGVIAFATNSPTGVQYLNVGDPNPKRIPGGEEFSADVFHVAGKKIVLVKGRQLFIYDTARESGFPIPTPTDEISLILGDDGPRGSQLLSVDGYLVATVNDTEAVTDKTLIKVVDISQDQPKIIPIENADYAATDVTSLAVNATTGQLAVSSRVRQRVYLAKVMKSALQQTIDLSNHGGIDERPIQIAGRYAAYSDRKNRLHYVDVSTGLTQSMNTESLGATSMGFVVRNDQIALATQQKFGSRYRYLTGPFPGTLRPAPQLGEPIDGHPGYGMGGCAAIADDGTVFLAGTGDLGVGETLQAWQGGHWHVFRKPDGNPLPASDVTTGNSMLAFKSRNAAGKIVVAFATHGVNIALPTNAGSADPQIANKPRPTTPSQTDASPQTPITPIVTRNSETSSPRDSTPSTSPAADSGSQAWLIGMVFLANLGIGVFFTRKILKS